MIMDKNHPAWEQFVNVLEDIWEDVDCSNTDDEIRTALEQFQSVDVAGSLRNFRENCGGYCMCELFCNYIDGPIYPD